MKYGLYTTLELFEHLEFQFIGLIGPGDMSKRVNISFYLCIPISTAEGCVGTM
jgi:hypothetical protein